MTEERTDRIEMPSGNTHTTTTIITDEPKRSGTSGWFLMFVVLLAVVVAIWVVRRLEQFRGRQGQCDRRSRRAC